jgi:MFS family permease
MELTPFIVIIMNELLKFRIFSLFYSNAVGIFYALYSARLTVQYHLSATQLLTLNMIYVFSSILFEIPSGMVSDKLGHKKTIVNGVLCWFLSAFIFSYYKEYNQFVISEVFGALGFAFMSGSTDAWLGAQFKTSEEFCDYKRKLSQINRYVTFALMLSAGFLAKLLGYDNAYMISAGMYLVALAISLTFSNPTTHTELKSKKIALTSSLKTYFGNPILRLSGFLGFFNQCFIVSVVFLWSPLVKLDFKIDDSYLGLIYGIMCIGGVLGGLFESKLQHKLNQKVFRSEFFFLCLKGIAILFVGLISTTNHIAAIFGLVVVVLLNEANLQFSSMHLNSHWRGRADEATLASIYAFVSRIGNPFGCVLLGYIADHYSRAMAFNASGIGMILSSLGIIISYVAFKKPKTLVTS